MTKPAHVNNPWKVISAPTAGKLFAGRRADNSSPDVYWGRDSTAREALVFVLDKDAVGEASLPKINKLSIEARPADDPNKQLLMITLGEKSLRDLFHVFCLDLIARTRSCATDQAAAQVLLNRINRWKIMLQSGSTEKLGPEAQIGLIGELIVLERFLLPNIDAIVAVDSWIGPERKPQDFMMGATGIEAKARGKSKEAIRISSLEQLSTRGIDALYLCVTSVASDPGSDDTLTTIVERILDSVENSCPDAVLYLRSKLVEAGFTDEQDYSSDTWSVGETAIYYVSDKFPRLDRLNIDEAVVEAQYSLSLSTLTSFTLAPQVMVDALLDVIGT